MIKKATYVKPEGNKESCLFALVGEQPGRSEVLTRKPFVGPAGKELNGCLSSAGISRFECYLTNVIKDLDLPLANYIKFNSKGVGTYSPDGKEYLEILREELDKCSAKIIIAIGNVSLFALTSRYGITKWRGSLLDSTLLPGRKVIPIIHPATVIPPKNVYLNRRLIINDLMKADRESKSEGSEVVRRNIQIGPSFYDSLSFLNLCYDLGKKGGVIDFDIEVYNNYTSCISFAHSPVDAISIPFVDSHGDYFTVEQESEIWRAIALILEDRSIIKRGQNLGFDSTALLSQFGIKTHNIIDTMVAQKILSPDYPAGLDFIASIHTDIPYYKAEGKRWFKVGGLWETLWHYNAMDSITCADAYVSQLKALEKQDNMGTFYAQCDIIEPLVYMMVRGMKVDTKGMLIAKTDMDENVITLQKRLDELAGQPLNANSSAQLVWYFYDHLGHKPYLKKGKVTTDDTALTRLLRKGVKEAKIVKEIRTLRKLSSTYTDLDKVDADGRIRCSYNPVGTVTGRISSSKNIYGTGMNMQNWPHSLHKYLLADDGYVYYSLDLSQIENRIVAYVGRVPRMMDAFEMGKDVHSLTASLIFDKPVEEISNEEGSSPLGTGTYSERFWGKKCLTGETEVLTPRGWKKIEDVKEGAEIAQWHPITKEISFAQISNKSIYVSPVIELSGRNVHVKGSPEHKIPLYRKDKGTFKTQKLKDIKSDNHYGIPLSGKFNNPLSLLTSEEVKLLVAFQADGSFAGKSCKFGFKKHRKILRLAEILTNLSIPFKVYEGNHETFSIVFKGPYWLTKKFDSRLLLLGQDEMQTFMKELVYWDGYHTKVKKEYFSTIKQNAEWVQTIAHLSGYKALIRIQKNSETNSFGNRDVYIVHFNNRNINATLVSQSVKDIEEQLVFGVEVETGFFMIRSEGRISITGNSNHSFNYDLGFRSFALLMEMPENEAKWLIERYHRKYPEVRGNYHSMVKLQLSKDRTLTNLFGRKRVFLGMWEDKLFKEAFAHIPQSTTADKINRQGLSYIYNNQEKFGSLELLNQVHDSIGFQLPITIPWTKHAEILIDIKKSMETPLTWGATEFVVPVDIQMGLSMSKSDGIEFKHGNFPSTVQEFAKELERAYNGFNKE